MRVKPSTGEGCEVPAAEALSQREELPGRAVTVGVASKPRAQQSVERLDTDHVAQGLSGHGASGIHGQEQVVGPRVARAAQPELVAATMKVVQINQLRVESGTPVPGVVEPGHPDREALVEPEIPVAVKGNTVAEPLVGQLVDHHIGGLGPAERECSSVVDRTGLRLDRGDVHRRHDPADVPERVRPELSAQPGDPLEGW